MIDIKLIRENLNLVKENIKKKYANNKLHLVDKVAKKDIEWRNLKIRVDKLRAERNSISKDISKAKKEGKSVSQLMKIAKVIPTKINEVEKKLNKIDENRNDLLKKIPNIIHKSVPIGKDSTMNVVREVIGKPKKMNFRIENHALLGEQLNILNFDTSSSVSGNGFYYLKGDLALLNMALINYARDFMIKKDYTYVEPPLMIRKEILDGVYSKDEINQMSFKIDGEDLYLIATSEHPVIGMFINKILKKEDLPIKLTAYSMCFRKEIGSHGIDEKGLYRTHQFNKQEMIILCKPEDSYKYYEELLNLSKKLFQSLEIPIREIESCSGDLGDLKSKGADLEAWSPRREEYFEITSVSNMESAQARRLNIKYLNEKNERVYVHTLNNTAIATSRALVAIMENNQNEDGTINVPKVLWPYLNGKKKIGK